MMITKNRKKAQEEMVGFALIIIIVAVILLVFIGFSLKDPQKETVESYEVNSFIQAFLSYTTDCEESEELNYLSIQQMIIKCNRDEKCLDERETCEVLNADLTGILEESWKIGENWPVKGYKLAITSEEDEVLIIQEGNLTANYKGSAQYLSEGGRDLSILFTAYY